MPLFQRKKDRVDITRHWVGDTRFALELDFSSHSLSGARIGSSIDALMRMGPVEDAESAAEEVFRWYSRGVEVTAEEGFITGFRILWVEAECFKPYSGRCFLRNEAVTISRESTESDLLALFGAHYWRDEDESEVILFYEFGKIEWQIELNASGRLSQMSLLSPPLMAHTEQREAYGVTRIWPPASTERIRPRIAESFNTRAQ